MARLEIVPLTQQEDLDFLAEDKIVRNTARPTQNCLAALERIYERKLWRGRFDSFDDYCRQRFDRSGSYMSRQIKTEQINQADFLPAGKKLPERHARALLGFRSEHVAEIYERAVEEAGSHENLTGPIIERVGRAVQDEHCPTPPAELNEYDDEADEEDSEPDMPDNDEVNKAVAAQTAPPKVHPLVAWFEHCRIGDRKGAKVVDEDMEDETLRGTAEELLALLNRGVKRVQRWLAKGK